MPIICADCDRPIDRGAPHLCRPSLLARDWRDDPFADMHGAGDLVPGYLDSPDGAADAADQRRMDGAR